MRINATMHVQDSGHDTSDLKQCLTDMWASMSWYIIIHRWSCWSMKKAV